MARASKPTATFYRLKVEELDRFFELAVIPTLAICPNADALDCAFVSSTDVATDKDWIYRSDLLFSPTQVMGLRNDARYVRTGESLKIIPHQIPLPDYKVPWPPFLPFQFDAKLWRVIPKYDTSKAYLVNDPMVVRSLDYGGSIGAFDLYYKILVYGLLLEGLEPLHIVEKMKPNALQLSMARAIVHDHS